MDGKLKGLNGNSPLHEIKIPNKIKMIPEEERETYQHKNKRFRNACVSLTKNQHLFLNKWAINQGYPSIASYLKLLCVDILKKNNIAYSRFVDDKYKDVKIEYNGIQLD